MSIKEEEIFTQKDFLKEPLENLFFTNCSFFHCNFSQVFLKGFRFCSCLFEGCNFSLSRLDGCRMQNVEFIDCKIVGVEFFKCERTFFSANYKNSFLHYCNFSDLSMKSTIFKGSRVKETHFINTSLIGSDFKDVDLEGTVFHHCDLSKADFTGATHYEIDPQVNKIKGAKFSLPEAIGLLRGFDIIVT